MPGKVDWMAAGLPREGESTQIRYAGDLADRDIPTGQFRDSLDNVETALGEHGFCAVVTDDNTVMGMLYADDLRDRGSDATVEQSMHTGLTTVRANEPVDHGKRAPSGCAVGPGLKH